MNIEKLVPPLELCQKIPAGEFEDSAFIWDKTTSIGFWDGEDKDGNHIGGFGKIPHTKYRLRQNYSERCRKHIKDQNIELDIFPAPNLVEIMAKLPHSICYKHAEPGHYTMRTGGGFDLFLRDENPSTAALKLWLELNKKGN